MKTSTTLLYWKIIGCCFIAGVVVAVAVMAVYYATVAIQSTGGLLAALRWGTTLGVTSGVFVVLGTIATTRKLDRTAGRITFVLLSFIAPIVGWVLVGITTGLTATWHFFWGYPIIGFVAGILSGIIALLATFFMPHSAPDADAPDALVGASDLFGV